MPSYFEASSREWIELQDGVFASKLHRYASGGGAALFRMRAGATMSEHDHPTGEHGYVISGEGDFGSRRLRAGDGFWMQPGDTHAITAITELVFFAASVPSA